MNKSNSKSLLTTEQIKTHYDIEKELAGRLRNSSKEERRYLYSLLYDELYCRVPYHPQNCLKENLDLHDSDILARINLIDGLLKKESVYLEIGPGDCEFCIAVARRVRWVYAIDVTGKMFKKCSPPENVTLCICQGCDIPVPSESINLAYSHNLIEHLHPDDLLDHLRNVYKALEDDSSYVCITPNRISGPHDISRYFDREATGLHLREYTHAEILKLFKLAGFSDCFFTVGARGVYFDIPLDLFILCERIMLAMPHCIRIILMRLKLVNFLFGAIIVRGVKNRRSVSR